MNGIRIPQRAGAKLRRATVEPLEDRRMLSGTFAHAGAVAMAYDPAGTLHVAYYDTAVQSLKYAECNTAGVWSATTIVDSGRQVGSSLAMNSNPSGHRSRK